MLPSRTRLSPGLYVNFSDCDVNAGFMPAHLSYLSRRLDLPDLTRLLKEQPGGGERERELTWALRDLFCTVNTSRDVSSPRATIGSAA